jgi:hypothetical protein
MPAKLPAKDRRTEKTLTGVRLTPAEAKALRRAARAAGLSLADFTRARLFGPPPAPVPLMLAAPPMVEVKR